MEREALKLHSITFTSLSLQMNWMLKGPGHTGRMMIGWKCSMQAEESCSLESPMTSSKLMVCRFLFIVFLIGLFNVC